MGNKEIVIDSFNVLIFYNGIDSLMCLQDVKVGEGLKVALCMFDGGSNLILLYTGPKILLYRN